MNKKEPIGKYSVDGYNLAAVIQKTSHEGRAGTWRTVCVCRDSVTWKEDAARIASLLEADRAGLFPVIKEE